jgi:hypothetical protein
MTVTITRAVHIDFGRDGTYGHASADVSAYVLSATFSYGFTGMLEEVAAPAQLTLVLTNTVGGWWQDDAGAAFYVLLRPGLLVRVQYVYSGDTYTAWEGRIAVPIRYEANPYSARTVTIVATDDLDALNVQDYTPALARATTVDVEIAKVLQSGAFVNSYYEDVWVLGASVLGTNTRLPNAAARYTLETGIETLDYVGAFSGGSGGSTAGQYIRELVASERGGRFFWDAPSGKFLFFNRWHGLATTASSRTVTQADFLAAEVGWGGGLVNKVFMNYALLEEGAAGGTVYQADNLPMRLRKGETKEFKVQFSDPSNDAVKVAVVDPVLPVAGTDYVANANEGGDGADITNAMAVGVTWSANGAQWRIVNTNENDAYFTTLQLRGTPLTALDSQQVSDADASSISTNGYYPLTVNLPSVNDPEDAESYAHWLLRQFSATTTRFASITVLAENSATSALLALDGNVGDRITVQDTWTSHDADYFIIGRAHQDTGYQHVCTLYLRPVSTIVGWILATVGRGELGTNTYVVH